MSKEIPAFVCSHVFEKRRPILYVSRDDGDWQLLCGSSHEESEIPHVVGLNHFLEEDPSLLALLDLPYEWEAERSALGADWKRRPSETE